MAKANTETVRLRPNTIDENLAVLLEVQSRKLVDARKQDDLNVLFDRINADCASKSLQERRKALASSDKHCKISKPVHYGPQPGIISGKWWGIRMDCSRDCAHEPFNENIHEGPYGAVSICTSHLNNHYDVDLGDLLTFTTKVYSAADQVKDSLILSYKNQVPLRLVRSYCLSNDFAPKTGYRYDGLYTVVDHWVGVSSNQSKHRKFALVRVIDQEAPPWNERESKSVRHKSVTLYKSPKSLKSVHPHELESKRFVYAKIHQHSKERNAGVMSQQVFTRNIDGSLITSCTPGNHVEAQHESLYLIPCAPSSCNSNLSKQTNLYNASPSKGLLKQKNSSQLNTQEERGAMNIIMEVADMDEESMSNSSADEDTDVNMKKVRWADSPDLTTCRVDEDDSHHGNGLQSSNSESDKCSPEVRRSCGVPKLNSASQTSPTKSHSNGPNSSNPPYIPQFHSNSNASQSSKGKILSKSDSFHEMGNQSDTLCSIDSLAPDKLVSVLIKDTHHPMAQLIIGNMIGLENQESAILSAYNTLSSNYDVQESSKKSKENKLRSKFLLKARAKKNGMLSKHRREIANLMIDAKFDPIRGSRASRLRTSKIRIRKSESLHRKFVGTRRIQSSSKINHKDIRNSMRAVQTIKSDDRRLDETPGPKRPKMVSKSVQCSSLTMPSVDQYSQVDDSLLIVTPQTKEMENCVIEVHGTGTNRSKVKLVKGAPSGNSSYLQAADFKSSAFVAVDALNSSDRIARLRSIGFKPIGTCSPIEDESPVIESPRIKVDEEYFKYTSEDSDVVSYMHEHLHFEDIENEDKMAILKRNESYRKAESQSLDELFSKPVETLTEKELSEPWHGWKRVTVNGKNYWTGY
ncbi:hypothetical protein QAD02_019639 [Eretmocerus hayati]|uniref:Uncharacterized protein n=1 Tax=Eretmocerus hayati TaxID=131215 RepID=A0ACC2PNC9_9HYME|nr:hypothetical protein QAD02_019639 [Eretmocerus hayati]